MGLDLYYPFFKMIPELKFCFGLNNILDRNRTDLKDASLLKYSDALDKAQNGMIVLTLYFEWFYFAWKEKDSIFAPLYAIAVKEE